MMLSKSNIVIKVKKLKKALKKKKISKIAMINLKKQ